MGEWAKDPKVLQRQTPGEDSYESGARTKYNGGHPLLLNTTNHPKGYVTSADVTGERVIESRFETANRFTPLSQLDSND